MGAHGVLADAERLGHLGDKLTAKDEFEHVALAVREALAFLYSPAVLGGHVARDAGVENPGRGDGRDAGRGNIESVQGNDHLTLPMFLSDYSTEVELLYKTARQQQARRYDTNKTLGPRL